MNVDVMDEVEKASGRLEKERLLVQLKDETTIFIKWALDPIITFGVTVDQEEQTKSWNGFGFRTGHDKFWSIFDELCSDLSERKLTGNSALNAVDDVLKAAPTLSDHKWACRVLNKDLRCGVQLGTVNNVFPGLIEPFACALAKQYDPAKHELRGSWIVDSKLDGMRMVVLDGVAYTRNGRTLESVGHILKELEQFKDDWVFDGEVMGSTEFNEDSGKIRKKGEGPNTELYYNVFDVIDRQEWLDKKTKTLRERKKDLSSVLLDVNLDLKYVKWVYWQELPENPTIEQLFTVRDRFITLGFEGAMLKDLDACYTFGRSDDLLKLKRMETADGRIVGTQEGRGRHKGKLGSLLVEFDGVVTKVGSGFTDEQRSFFWSKKDDIIGKMVEADYQNKSKDGVLRFPVYIRMRPDKD